MSSTRYRDADAESFGSSSAASRNGEPVGRSSRRYVCRTCVFTWPRRVRLTKARLTTPRSMVPKNGGDVDHRDGDDDRDGEDDARATVAIPRAARSKRSRMRLRWHRRADPRPPPSSGSTCARRSRADRAGRGHRAHFDARQTARPRRPAQDCRVGQDLRRRVARAPRRCRCWRPLRTVCWRVNGGRASRPCRRAPALRQRHHRAGDGAKRRAAPRPRAAAARASLASARACAARSPLSASEISLCRRCAPRGSSSSMTSCRCCRRRACPSGRRRACQRRRRRRRCCRRRGRRYGDGATDEAVGPPAFVGADLSCGWRRAGCWRRVPTAASTCGRRTGGEPRPLKALARAAAAS